MLAHGIAISLPSSIPPSSKPIADMNIMWISDWRSTESDAPVARLARQDQSTSSDTHLLPARKGALSADISTRELLSAHDEGSSAEKPRTALEDKTVNHLLGLIRRSIQEHFVYPPFALRQGWEGEVLVELQLDADGEIHDIRVVRSSGYRILDEDALLILRRIGSIPNARVWLQGQQYSALIPVIYRLTG
ncbi:MAG: TonB family protein [Pseudomonadota bacterium]